MRKPLLVISWVMGTTMLFTAGLNSVTAQEKSLSELTPQGGWNVNRIEGNENTTDSYCALSRQYNEGVILTLGRNQAQEYSLAIDFQNAQLNTDKSVSLTLQPGPGQIRAYEMMPASQRAIVIRLGYDESFFKSLEESKFLKAEIDGKNYRFDIPDIANGQTQLTNCMQGLAGSSATKTASGFSAEKVADAAPMKTKEAAAEVKKGIDQAIAPIPKAEKVIETAKAPDEPEKVIIKAGEEEKAIKEYNEDQKNLETATVEKTAEDYRKMAAEQKAVTETPKPVIPKPEKIETTKLTATPPAPAPKIVAEVPEEPTKVAKVEAPVVEPPVKLETKPAEKVSVKPEEVAKAATAEAPPPPPLSGLTEAKSHMAKDDTTEPAQAVKIEADKSEVPSDVPGKAIEISKVESRKLETVVNENIAQEQAQKPTMEVAKIEEKPEVKKPEPKTTKDLNRMELARISKAPEVSSSYQPRMAMAEESGTKLNEVSKQPTDSPKMWNNAIQKKQRDELDRLKTENERLNTALKTQISQPVKPADAAKNNAEVEALTAQINKLQDDLAKAKTSSDPVDEKMNAELEKLKSENEQLRLAMKAQQVEKAKPAPAPSVTPAPVVEAAVDPSVIKQLENLKTENQRLSSALQGQEDKMASFDAKSPQAEKELEEMRKQIAALKAENEKLEVEARKTRGEVDSAVVSVGNNALSKIKEYEKKYEAAQADNLALSKEIEELRRMQEDTRLSSVAGDWDLEKATKRYNEAEREIKRLGLLLEQQRMAHRQEKTELEQMLFDPAVTESEQRRRLTELELQLAEAEKQLAASGRPMPQRPRSGIAPSDERVSVTSGMTPAPAPMVQAQPLQQPRMPTQPVARAPQPAPRQPVQQARAPEPVQRAPVTPMQTPPQQMQPAAQPAPRQVAPPPTQAAAPNFDQNKIQQILSQAGISLSGRVAKQSNNEYRWSAGQLTGHAQVVPKTQAGSLDTFAQNYIAEAKKSCGGDFASMPSAVAMGRGQSFEIACISPTRSTSSSIVFTERAGEMIAIAHEANADDLDAAMDARDRIAGSM